MGRIKLSSVPQQTSTALANGPTIDFIDPISPEIIKQDWQTFVENGGFREILQKVVKENIANEQTVINDAKSLQGGEGWVHVCDERALPPYVPGMVVDLGLDGFRSRRILLGVFLFRMVS
jgi:hypothetical protein